MITLESRYRGTLLGVLAGDALGGPYETWSAKQVRADIQRRGGLQLFDYPDPWDTRTRFPAGRPTDDSEMTAALAMTLRRGFYEMGEEYEVFQRVAYGRSLLWDGPSKGFGKTTLHALKHDDIRKSLTDTTVPVVDSNGSLMRSSPFALAYRSKRWDINKYARRSSFITHRSQLCGACCSYYASILVNVLNGMQPREAISSITSIPKELLEIENFTLQQLLERPADMPRMFPARGAVLLSLQAALWSFTAASSFEDGIQKAISLGGDTDTYAAIAGALLGAYWGAESIPDVWLKQLKGVEVMTSLADDLFRVSKTGMLSGAE